MKQRIIMVATASICGCFLSANTPVLASPMVFEGQNAGLFRDANPNGFAILMNSVDRPHDPNVGGSSQLTPAELIQQSVTSQVSNKIYNDIFNTGNASGTYQLGGGNSISFSRSGGNVIISIIDPVNGNTTITLPDI